MSVQSNKSINFSIIIVSVMVLTVVASSLFSLFIKKDYTFVVEAPCNPQENTCFLRYCGETEECPPNELEYYRLFSLGAEDFETCADNSCLNECTLGAISCEETQCDESVGDACIFTPPAVEESITPEDSENLSES